MHRLLLSLVVLGALAVPITLTGCYSQVRVYDQNHHDYHNWNHHEVVYYQHWETSTHRNHREFKDRDSHDQQEYWEWRHNQH